ncbi:CAP domain-containing protein [Haloarcula japonica]|uniref:CAP domain-containing protein n=1 Tax=Haloarcula japonica TaxID=29282 RepID=UPI001267C473|nr:CAP domain-containing protein [Haloarcula japonica]
MRTSLQAAIGIIMVFMLVGSIGLLLGGMLGSSENSPAETPTEGVETTTQPATATPSMTATSSPTVTPDLASTEQNLSTDHIESLIKSNINDHPDSVTTLSTDTTTAVKLDNLSKNHSNTMSQSATVSHDVGYGNSETRYRNADLYERCQFKEQKYIANAKRNRLESIDRLNLNEYRGETAEITEQNVADTIVDSWFNSFTYRDRLRYENAEHLGVGVSISEDGQVYATATVC